MKLLLGDCLDKLKELEDNSVDSVVTDPPYGLSFMGKQWDYDVPSQEIWEECMRVLKPGGHLLAFAGSRTYHRMAVRIEDAGFEIRDQIMWVYGSGFPKSLNISKQIDKCGGVSSKIQSQLLLRRRELAGYTREYVAKKVACTVSSIRDWEEGRARKSGGSVEYITPSKKYRELLANLLGYTEDERSVIGVSVDRRGDNTTYGLGHTGTLFVGGKTDLAKEWEGWGTALKPAHEPIVMARKPLIGTVVDNVLEWGTGGINIDESRIGSEGATKRSHQAEYKKKDNGTEDRSEHWARTGHNIVEINKGRFPANIIFDEEAGKILDEQSGISKTGDIKPHKENTSSIYGDDGFFKNTKVRTTNFKGDSGGASRFFYCPKTSKTDRNEGLDEFEEKLPDTNDFKNLPSARSNSINTSSGKPRNVLPSKNNHPTVKPTDLMLYLIRLITPKGGTTLDPFMGSGSTGKGAVRGGFDFIGIEREEEYYKIAEARIDYEQKNPYIEETGKRVETNENSQKFW